MTAEEKFGYNPFIGEPHGWTNKADVNHRAVQQALYTLTLSSRTFARQRQLYDLYFQHYTNKTLKLRTRHGTQIPSGMAAEIADAFHADFMGQLYQSRPLVAHRPRGLEDADAARATEAWDTYTDDAMQRYVIDYDMTKSCVVYGAGPGKVYWVQKTVDVPIPGVTGPDGKPILTQEISYRGPWVDPIFIYDAYPDPRKVHIDDPYPVCSISWRGWDHFKRLARAGVYSKRQVDKIPDKSEMPENMMQALGDQFHQSDQMAEIGWSQDSRLEPDGILTIEWEGLFRYKPDADPVPSVITVANGVAVRVEPSPIVSREKSMVWMSMDRLPGQFHGQGVIGKALPHIHASNVTLNLALTNLVETVKQHKIVQPHLLRNPGSLDNPPGGVYETRFGVDGTNAVVPLKRQSLGRDIQWMSGLSREMILALSGKTELSMGRIPVGERTATESNIAIEQTAQRFKLPMKLIEHTGLVPIARKKHILSQMLLDEEMAFMVLGPNTIHYPMKVTPQQLAVMPDFIPMASQREASRSVAINGINAGLKVLTPLAGIDSKYLAAVDELIIRLFQEFQFPEVGKLEGILRNSQPPPAQGGQGGGPRIPEAGNMVSLANSIGGRLSQGR